MIVRALVAMAGDQTGAIDDLHKHIAKGAVYCEGSLEEALTKLGEAKSFPKEAKAGYTRLLKVLQKDKDKWDPKKLGFERVKYKAKYGRDTRFDDYQDSDVEDWQRDNEDSDYDDPVYPFSDFFGRNRRYY